VKKDRTVAFFTLGCKLNQFESFDLERQFTRRGYSVLPFRESASVYVINTCTVTGKSDYRCRQTIRKARKRNPDATVVAVGCYAQTQPGVLAGMPEVDLVLGNSEKTDIFRHLSLAGGERVRVSSLSETRAAPFGEISSFGSHTRAFVKIQDGCDARCSYCIVPDARGPNRSRPAADVLAQVEKLAGEGYREVVLTGVHLGTWGRDLSPADSLAALLTRLARAPGPERLRLSSIEPTEFTPDLVKALKSERICPHLHIPLQSGSPRVLRAMRRPYDPDFYASLVEKISDDIPDLALGADVIAGFPGESGKDFQETVEFIERLPLSYLHVFPYSKRPGTAAAELPDQVAPEERERRAALLRKLGRDKAGAFRRDRIGRSYTALIETQPDRETGLGKALTGNYLKVLVEVPEEAANTLRRISITGMKGGKIYGTLEE
jgi:threonylcarbamoyladenosine tRNA methylthiotransferase MtaB